MLGDNSEASLGVERGKRAHQSFIYSIYSGPGGRPQGSSGCSRRAAGSSVTWQEQWEGQCPLFGLSRHSALFCPGQGHTSPPRAQALWNVCLQLLLAGLANGGCQGDEPREERLVLTQQQVERGSAGNGWE